MTRALTDAESNAIRIVAERLAPDAGRQLLADLHLATAESVTPDGSRIAFSISGYQRPPYRGQRSFGVQGDLLDKDGVKLTFDLFADENGRLLEMELIRWAEGSLVGPDWTTLKLY